MLGKQGGRCYKFMELRAFRRRGISPRETYSAEGLMRLTCPNCGARYEVDDSMIPPEGRDVQCSNCATTWFQPGRRTDTAPGGVTVFVERVRRPSAAQASDAEAEDDAASPEAELGETPPAPPPDAPRPPRRDMDPAVRDILRAEAEREARLRRGAPDPVETQAEMSLEDDPAAARRARRQRELEGAQDAFEDPEEDAQATVGARRDLLPDIEEINSTLRATADRSSEERTASDIDTLDTAPRRRRGARIGFLLVVLIAAIGAAIYSNADLWPRNCPRPRRSWSNSRNV